jgi:hypothetical protein
VTEGSSDLDSGPSTTSCGWWPSSRAPTDSFATALVVCDRLRSGWGASRNRLTALARRGQGCQTIKAGPMARQPYSERMALNSPQGRTRRVRFDMRGGKSPHERYRLSRQQAYDSGSAKSLRRAG